MVDVTQENFLEVLPQFKDAVNSCDFISIDCEFTGLQQDWNTDKAVGFDSFQSRWDKVKKACDAFGLLQLGVCTFRVDNASKRIVCRAFNFYMHPADRPEKCFVVQASSLRFLTRNNFDFNKCFSSGISFLNIPETAALTQSFESKMAANSAKKDGVSPGELIALKRLHPDDKELVSVLLSQVESLCAQEPCVGAELDEQGNTYVSTSKPINGFTRRVLYQHLELIQKDHQSRMHITATKSDGCRASQKEVRVTVCATVEARVALANSETEAENAVEREALEMSVGIGSVARMISESRKPVVGHNCFMDFGHIMGKLLMPLPVDAQEFQHTCHDLLPIIVDTKHMLIKDTELRTLSPYHSLGEAVATMTDNQTIESFPVTMAPGFTKYDLAKGNKLYEHEAAYDALLTGLLFVKCASVVVGKDPSMLGAAIRSLAENRKNAPHPRLAGLTNHLHMMRMDESFDMLGNEPMDRSCWVNISNFARGVKPHHLVRMVDYCLKHATADAAGGGNSQAPRPGDMRIVWQDQTAVFIVLPDVATAKLLVAAKLSPPPPHEKPRADDLDISTLDVEMYAEISATVQQGSKSGGTKRGASELVGAGSVSEGSKAKGAEPWTRKVRKRIGDTKKDGCVVQ